MISNRAVTALLLIATLVVVASPAAAQYMYLDANGNGVRDFGDRLAPNGSPTTVDVWLVTDHNRDGSPVVCPQDPDAPMTLVSYVVNLVASGGTASYGGFTTHIGNVAFGEFNPGDGTNYKNGFGLTFFSPPGTYRLCTLTITGLAGTPRIDIVDQVPGSTSVNGGPAVTSFGSACVGNEFDSTYKLAGPQGGSDWTDVDGLDRFVIDEGTPVLAAIGNKTVNEGNCLTFTATATAPNGNPVSFSLTGQPPVGASITTAGQFNWCPTEAQGPGVYPITVTVTDNGSGNLSDSETIQVTVNEVNVAPVLTAIGNKTVAAGNTLAFTATATDGDLPANTLTFSLDPGAPVGAAITAGGNFTWTPTQSQAIGNYPITIRVTDNGVPALSDAKSFAVYVPQGETGPPVVTNPGNKTVNEGECLNFTIAATSPGGNPLTFALGAGSPSGASISFGGQFIWCPTEAQGPGIYAITVNVSDGTFTTSTIFTVTVLEVNLAPVLNPIGNKTAPLGSPFTFTATATDADIPANTRTFSLDPGAPAGATIGAATGVFSWTPNASGTFPVTIRVTDNGTPPLSDPETILIVACVCANTAPFLSPIGNKTVNELALLSFTATATDPDAGQTLTFSLGAGAPAGAAITAGGAFTWTPTEAQGPGVFPITVIVTDDGTANLSDSETIQVTVLEVNQAPVVTNPGNKTADEGLLLSFNVVATDADLPAQTLTFSLSSPIPPGASIASGGTFRWTPAENEGGIDWPVTVCVNDGATGLTDCETINITVIENNIAPVLASIGTKVVAPGATLSFVATATDADIPAQTLTFSLDPGAPPGASITAGGAFTWTTGPIGTFPITIRVIDTGSPPVSDSETFLVVVGQGSPPVLNPIADMTVNEGAVGTQTISASDPDNQSLQFSKQSGPFWVSIQTVGPTTGLVTASPDLSAGGASYPVTAYVTDGLLSDQRSFMVQVTESCSPPVADAGGPYSGVTWFPVTFEGTGSTDPDGDIQAYGWDFGDGLTASGVTVMHAYLQPGTYTVVLYVSDVCSGTSDSDQTSVTISDCYSTLAFVAGGNKQINLLNEKPTWCVQLEAFGGTFDVATIDPSSLVMRSTGTGSVSEIHALTDKTSVGGDRNGNGYTELSACFRKEDLRQLFSLVTGTQQVQVTFEGNLLVGGRTCSSLTITVKGGGGAVLAASISPNPLNPSAVLTFSTQERGPVLVQLFDVRGRLLRTLRDEADAAAGYHDVRIDGTTANGTRLSSGIYYVRIRAGAEEERKAITILK